MLDINGILENPKRFEEGLARKGLLVGNKIVTLKAMYSLAKKKIAEENLLREERNKLSRGFRETSSKEKQEEIRNQVKVINDKIELVRDRHTHIANRVREILMNLPNLPSPESPNEVEIVQENRYIYQLPREAKNHYTLGEDLGIIDTNRGAKITNSGFYVLKGLGARLQRALINWMLDYHNQAGYEELYVPSLVSDLSALSNGNLPKFADTMYRTEDKDYLIPTGELPITNFHRTEIIDVPKKYVTHTPCYRKEQISAGKDNRGIQRVMQFEKVELYQFTEQDSGALQEMLAHIESLVQELRIDYRIVHLPANDIAFQAADTYDIELFLPMSQKWVEVSSISNCTDFQARRAFIRYKDEKGENKPVHTFNGSGLALPRVILAVLENYQQKNGKIKIPRVLNDYMR